MINGVTDLIMTKPDVLSGFDEIKVCTHYKIKNDVIDYLPFDIVNENVIPVYKTMKGWKNILTGMYSENEFPETMNEYISYLEKELNVPISIVSVGPDRKQTIFRNRPLILNDQGEQDDEGDWIVIFDCLM